ncbi:unnamed protein product [Symbiodinium sp. CCMP2456]|nr:unnamed protein product [Symbiodinium sp. CCMP2456]
MLAKLLCRPRPPKLVTCPSSDSPGLIGMHQLGSRLLMWRSGFPRNALQGFGGKDCAMGNAHTVQPVVLQRFAQRYAHLSPMLRVIRHAAINRAWRDEGMIWHRTLAAIFPETGLRLLGTDLSEQKIATACKGEYPWYSLKGLPLDWCEQFFDSPATSTRGLRPRATARLQAARAFASQGAEALYRVKDKSDSELRADVEFLCQDVTEEMPEGPFDVILSRYAVCLYLQGEQRAHVLVQMVERLRPGGFLVIGGKDHLPNGFCEKNGLIEVDYRAEEIGLGDVRCIFQKSGGAALDSKAADRRGRAPCYSQYVRSLGSEPYWVAERRRLERQRLAVQMSQKSRDLLKRAVQEGRRHCDSPFTRESTAGRFEQSPVETSPSMPKEERELRLQSFLQRLEKDLAERGRKSLKAEIERLDCLLPGLPKLKGKRKKKRKKRRRKKAKPGTVPAAEALDQAEQAEHEREEDEDEDARDDDLTPDEDNFDSILFAAASGGMQFF